ncbi:hypothetical protein G9A89_004905 [Geosiphon pyriformis]|nr:hypothetical protein G9A89_004905 [Geosiphon pyriformis]
MKKFNTLNKSLVNAIPPEIFIEICKDLTPDDLVSLSQHIWRMSRFQFLPLLQFDIPPGLNEKSYIELSMTQRGCQFCRVQDPDSVKFTSIMKLLLAVKEGKKMTNFLSHRKCNLSSVRQDFTEFLPFIERPLGIFLYWLPHIENAESEYFLLQNPEEKIMWKHRAKLHSLMTLIHAYRYYLQDCIGSDFLSHYRRRYYETMIKVLQRYLNRAERDIREAERVLKEDFL